MHTVEMLPLRKLFIDADNAYLVQVNNIAIINIIFNNWSLVIRISRWLCKQKFVSLSSTVDKKIFAYSAFPTAQLCDITYIVSVFEYYNI